MTPVHVRTILDALDYQECALLKQVDREPKTRGGKPNILLQALRKDLDAIADARLAFRHWRPE